jgi:arsenical pump membrane protein
VADLAAFSILALTIGLALRRPRIGRLTIDHTVAALLGTLLCVATGLVSQRRLLWSLEFLTRPVITILSLMIVTRVAEEAGVFRHLARHVAHAARGDARRLFTSIFALGAVTGSIFTNDAAVLIFTPLVFDLLEEVQGEGWTARNKLPFYFAVLAVANVAGALVISNPINLVVAEIIGLSFGQYAAWMILPALVSILASYAGIRLFFRRDLPLHYRLPAAAAADSEPGAGRLAVCGGLLALTLAGLFSVDLTGIPTWAVAASSAGALLLLHRRLSPGSTYGRVFKGIGWDALAFVVGIFIMTRALQSSSTAHAFGDALASLARADLPAAMHVTGFSAAALSALINNHPTADFFGLTIAASELPALPERMLALSALIGADLGPKMLPVGSLAALMWFSILRRRGVHVSYGLYVRIGVPVTLGAVLLALLTLYAELRLFEAWG